jgi:hypothetical protein
LRTISTTLIARATDLFTDNGASELASILLHDQHPDIQFPSTDDFDERRGIMMSPEKGGKGREKFVRCVLSYLANLKAHIFIVQKRLGHPCSGFIRPLTRLSLTLGSRNVSLISIICFLGFFLITARS